MTLELHFRQQIAQRAADKGPHRKKARAAATASSNASPSGGVFTFNTAYYDYDTNVTTNNANANTLDGRAWLAEVGYLLASELRVGRLVGRLRPVFRWQEYNRTFSQVSATSAALTRAIDLELQYVIAGSNARLSAGWGQRDLTDRRHNADVFLLGAQLQF